MRCYRSNLNLPNRILWDCLIKIDKAKPPARRGCSAYASESVIHIGRSILDVRCSTFNLFYVLSRFSFILEVQGSGFRGSTVQNCE